MIRLTRARNDVAASGSDARLGFTGIRRLARLNGDFTMSCGPGIWRRLRWLILSIAISAGWTFHSAAAAPRRGPLPYTVRIWQTDDGLPQNSVYDIAQTSDGYLWVGTREGLARFDGVRFTVVDDPAAPELRHAWVTALCTGKDGGLWVGLEAGGVTRLKDGVFLPPGTAPCGSEAGGD